jgi:hypothetical protein
VQVGEQFLIDEAAEIDEYFDEVLEAYEISESKPIPTTGQPDTGGETEQ